MYLSCLFQFTEHGVLIDGKMRENELFCTLENALLFLIFDHRGERREKMAWLFSDGKVPIAYLRVNLMLL